MNERIKLLAEQAEKYADDNFRGQPTYSEAYDSKFAELIVRECIDVVSDCSVEYCTRPQIASEIKEHFGGE